jgi:hypothetical protein
VKVSSRRLVDYGSLRSLLEQAGEGHSGPSKDPIDLPTIDERKTAAARALADLRAHGHAGIECNLQAAAAVAALKAALPHGEFGRFCTETLQISPTYRARLVRLDEVKGYLSEALGWAATQKHRLAECQSVHNLIKVVDDWLSRDKTPEPKSDSKAQERRGSKDGICEQERVIRETAALIKEREAISEREFEIAGRDTVIADLRQRLAECEHDIVGLRDTLPDEAREAALEALTSSRNSAADELEAIAKRYHWRLKDLRRELESFTAVEISPET